MGRPLDVDRDRCGHEAIVSYLVGPRITPNAWNLIWDHISTSFIERQNLTMRMSMRRFTRLTNGFSKKAANHAHAVAIHYLHYNFARIHRTLRVTPAMAAGISDHVWSIEEIVGLLGAAQKTAA